MAAADAAAPAALAARDAAPAGAASAIAHPWHRLLPPDALREAADAAQDPAYRAAAAVLDKLYIDAVQLVRRFPPSGAQGADGAACTVAISCAVLPLEGQELTPLPHALTHGPAARQGTASSPWRAPRSSRRPAAPPRSSPPACGCPSLRRS